MSKDGNMPGSILEAQVQRLLAIVEDYRQSQSESLLEQARQDARAILRQARQEARHRLREAIQDTRRHIQEGLSAARAKQHTAMMQQRHRVDLDFLECGWGLLAEKLQARWDAPGSRWAWIVRIRADAMRTVPGRDWLIEHPDGWTEAEQARFRAELNDGSDRQVQFRCRDDLSAGLRIVTEGAVVDGSLQGLLADRPSIEALLLAKRPGEITGESRVTTEGLVE